MFANFLIFYSVIQTSDIISVFASSEDVLSVNLNSIYRHPRRYNNNYFNDFSNYYNDRVYSTTNSDDEAEDVVHFDNKFEAFAEDFNTAAEEEDQIESSFGTFITENQGPNYNLFEEQHGNWTNIKRPVLNTTTETDDPNPDRVNTMLKNYLLKLYQKKFTTTPDSLLTYDDNSNEDDEDKSGKFFDGDSLHAFKNKNKKFANKFLSLFTIVKFPNAQCQGVGAGGTYSGTCYHQSQCQILNGTALGPCADNYGVCCVYLYTCGASSSQNCSYFQSPNYPNYDPSGNGVLPPTATAPPPNYSPTPDPRFPHNIFTMMMRPILSTTGLYKEGRQSDSTSLSCVFKVYKTSSDVQQIRIDFVDLELRGPTNGTCVDERLVITGQTINQIPAICGYNTGQHVYVDVSNLMGPLQVSVLSNSGTQKRFKLRICQYASNCTNMMIDGCLQYYTGVTGMVSSFNYDQAAMFNRSSPSYFNNLNYAICVRREAGYCSITYSNTPAGVEYPFDIRNVDNAGVSTIPPGQAGADVLNCPNDYIVIGGTRLCGQRFNDGNMFEDFTRNVPVTVPEKTCKMKEIKTTPRLSWQKHDLIGLLVAICCPERCVWDYISQKVCYLDSSAGPIVIPFRTNQAVTGRGFKLYYTQNPCSNANNLGTMMG